MSIDFSYIKSGNQITPDYLQRILTDRYQILKVTTNNHGVVSYFAVNPKEQMGIVYKDDGYEFHLQSDGTYWHPILTRDDSEFEVENAVLGEISFLLDLQLVIE